MGVTQLGGDVELEVLRVLYGGVTQFDAETATLFERLLQQQGLQDGIQLFLNIFKQHLGWRRKKSRITGETLSTQLIDSLIALSPANHNDYFRTD